MPRGLSILNSIDVNLEQACKGKLKHLKTEDRKDLDEAWVGFSDEDRSRLVRASKSIGLLGDWRLLVDRVSHADLCNIAWSRQGRMRFMHPYPMASRCLPISENSSSSCVMKSRSLVLVWQKLHMPWKKGWKQAIEILRQTQAAMVLMQYKS